jgi:hypothetical protein
LWSHLAEPGTGVLEHRALAEVAHAIKAITWAAKGATERGDPIG